MPANSKVVGTVSAKFSITVDGLVTSSVGNGIDPNVSQCVAGIIRTIKFPRPLEAVEVRYPLHFSRRMGASNPGSKISRRADNIVSIRLQKLSVSGGLSNASARRRTRRKLRSVKYCYEKELQTHANLEGVLSIRIFINSDGTVKSSSASGLNDEFANCVATAYQSMRFAKLHGGAVIYMTYQLQKKLQNTVPSSIRKFTRNGGTISVPVSVWDIEWREQEKPSVEYSRCMGCVCY